MELNCAILHADQETINRLEEYIGKVPFLSLRGKYTNPLEALKEYYETKVEVYFVGICQEYEGGIGGMDFCRMLSLPTRVIFVAESSRYAAECFRLDALDYLEGEVDFSIFFQTVNKAVRWFALQNSPVAEGVVQKMAVEDAPRMIYVRSDNRIIRLELSEINYIEGLGDYVKIFCRRSSKPVISLCSMKYLEEKLPADEFIRIHRSFIVRKGCIDAIGRSSVIVEEKDVPIGDAYRERLKHFISRLAVL